MSITCTGCGARADHTITEPSALNGRIVEDGLPYPERLLLFGCPKRPPPYCWIRTLLIAQHAFTSAMSETRGEPHPQRAEPRLQGPVTLHASSYWQVEGVHAGRLI